MNKYWYSYGNIVKIFFRKHICYKCGTNLSIVEHRKIVDPKSEEAKYYDFNAGTDGGAMVGPCEFIHKVFFCPNCKEEIEFITQVNLEDIDVIIDGVEKYFKKNGKNLTISKAFEIENGTIRNEINNLPEIKSLYLLINTNETQEDPLIYRALLKRRSFWERPFYFDLKRKQLIKYIKNNFINAL